MSTRNTLMLTPIVALCWLNAAPAASEPVTAVRFELDEHGGIIVPVMIGGAGPFRFLLDTGASGSSVSEALVARIDAPIVAKADIATPTGQTTTFVAALREVRLGVMSSEKILAVTIPGDVLGPTGKGVVGILGQDFLRPHNYTLDYRHRTLTWDEGDIDALPAYSQTLRLVPQGGQLLVELPQGNSPAVRMVPDSGADALVLFARPDVRLPVTRMPGAMQLAGMVGTRAAVPAVVPRLKVGSITLRNQQAVAVTLNADDPHTGDGLLPLHHFASVSFRASGYIVVRR